MIDQHLVGAKVKACDIIRVSVIDWIAEVKTGPQAIASAVRDQVRNRFVGFTQVSGALKTTNSFDLG